MISCRPCSAYQLVYCNNTKWRIQQMTYYLCYEWAYIIILLIEYVSRRFITVQSTLVIYFYSYDDSKEPPLGSHKSFSHSREMNQLNGMNGA